MAEQNTNCVDICLVEDDEVGAQKCYMAVEMMEKLEAKIGDFVKFTCKDRSFICSVWPKLYQDPGMVKVNKCVQSLGKQDMTDQSDLLEGSAHNIKLLKTERASSVKVKVIIDRIENVAKARKMLKISRHLHTVISDCMFRMCIAQGFVLDCKKLRYANFNGISSIFVLEARSDLDNGNIDAYIIDKNTDIIIDSVQSKEWFDQRNKSNRLKIGGLDSVVNMLADLIKLPLQHKKQFQTLGIDPPRGILLQGPPGCGKTSIVRYVANICETFLISVNGPEIFASHPGETESNLRNIFKKAMLVSEEGPCILFIDEIDSVCPRKGRSGSVQESRVTGQFLTLLDGLTADSGVVVVAATNRPGALDPAVRRPGRLDREVSQC